MSFYYCLILLCCWINRTVSKDWSTCVSLCGAGPLLQEKIRAFNYCYKNVISQSHCKLECQDRKHRPQKTKTKAPTTISSTVLTTAKSVTTTKSNDVANIREKCDDNWPDCMYFAKQGYCKTRKMFDVICCESCSVLSRAKQDITTKMEAKQPAVIPVTQKLMDLCYLPPKSGACMAYITQWYYDPKSKSCKQFIYGGCQGNRNRFHSKAQCQDTCGYLQTTIAAIKISTSLLPHIKKSTGTITSTQAPVTSPGVTETTLSAIGSSSPKPIERVLKQVTSKPKEEITTKLSNAVEEIQTGTEGVVETTVDSMTSGAPSPATTRIASTTALPTTIASTTALPTTIASTTALPTTIASTTTPPTTIASTTALPTTIASTTALPTTIASTTAPPTTDEWTLLQKNVCFGAKDNAYGSFVIKRAGYLRAFKFIHESGYISCIRGNSRNSNWGCLGYGINIVITNKNNKIIFPKLYDDYRRKYSPLAKELSLNIPFLRVEEGQEFRVWQVEDLQNKGEWNNHGRSCASVYGKISDTVKPTTDKGRLSQDVRPGSCEQLSRNSSGVFDCCVFPFVYKSKEYRSCVQLHNDRLWCANTKDFDKDQRWGNCVQSSGLPIPTAVTTMKTTAAISAKKEIDSTPRVITTTRTEMRTLNTTAKEMTSPRKEKVTKLTEEKKKRTEKKKTKESVPITMVPATESYSTGETTLEPYTTDISSTIKDTTKRASGITSPLVNTTTRLVLGTTKGITETTVLSVVTSTSLLETTPEEIAPPTTTRTTTKKETTTRKTAAPSTTTTTTKKETTTRKTAAPTTTTTTMKKETTTRKTAAPTTTTTTTKKENTPRETAAPTTATTTTKKETTPRETAAPTTAATTTKKETTPRETAAPTTATTTTKKETTPRETAAPTTATTTTKKESIRKETAAPTTTTTTKKETTPRETAASTTTTTTTTTTKKETTPEKTAPPTTATTTVKDTTPKETAPPTTPTTTKKDTTVSPSKPANCIDKTRYCQYYSKKNLCMHKKHRSFMKKACCETCYKIEQLKKRPILKIIPPTTSLKQTKDFKRRTTTKPRTTVTMTTTKSTSTSVATTKQTTTLKKKKVIRARVSTTPRQKKKVMTTTAPIKLKVTFDPSCVDNNRKAACKLIGLYHRLCKIKYYQRVCCRTCTLKNLENGVA